MADYMTTYSGVQVDPIRPDAGMIHLEDIAHALSLLCRGGGHLKHFYSVGQHSINCAVEAEARGLGDRTVLACLLHDASEAYLSDIIRPVKKHLPEYLGIERTLQTVIWDKFNVALSAEEMADVGMIDDLILGHEIEHLMRVELPGPAQALQGKCNFELLQSGDVEQAFFRMAKRYI